MVEIISGVAVVTFCSLIKESAGTNSTIVAEYTPAQPKVVITISIILFAVILAVVIAKVANVCHDRRRAVSDSSSDISENTRGIIKTRLALIMLQRKSSGFGIGQKFFKLWSRKVNSSIQGKENGVINVEEAQKTRDLEQGDSVAAQLNADLTKALEPSPNSPSSYASSRASNTSSSSSKNTTPRKSPVLSKKDTTAGVKHANVSPSHSKPRVHSGRIRHSSSNDLSGLNKGKKSVTFKEQVQVND